MSASQNLWRSRANRRSVLKMAGAGAGAAALAGYAGQRGFRAGAQDSTEISFWTPGGDAVFCAGFDTIGANFHAAHPDITVEEVQCGTGQETFNEVLLARVAAGDPPDSTILWTAPAAFAVHGALEPLDDLMASSVYSQVENWPEAVLASCQYEGKTYGLPATAGTYAVIYNQELLEAKGIPSDRDSFPKTWADLRALSKEFTQWDGDTLVSMGCLPRPGDGIEFAVVSASNGGQLYDATNQQYTIDSAQNVEIMQFFVDWLDEEYKGDYQKVVQSGNWSENLVEGQPPQWQGGKMLSIRTGFWITGVMYANAEPVFTKWDAATFPTGPSGTTAVSGYWPNWLVIPKGSKHVAEAFSYLDYMCVDGIKVWFDNVPDLPTNKQVPLMVPKVAIDRRGQEFADDITEFFRGLLDIATPMWTSPVVDFANDQLALALDKIMYKESSPEDALGEAQEASQGELERVLKSGS